MRKIRNFCFPVLLLVFLIGGSAQHCAAQAATWALNANTNGVLSGAWSGTVTAAAPVYGSTIDNYANYSGNGEEIDEWSASSSLSANSYVQFEITAPGSNSINVDYVSLQIRVSSGAASGEYEIEYSTNGTSYTSLGAAANIPQSGFGTATVSNGLPVTVPASGSFYVRVYLWYMAGSGDVWMKNVIISGAPLGPTITSFTPTSGCDSTTITITGTNLSGATSVTVGGTPVDSIISNTSTQIVAVVASGSTGKVAVTTAGGTATSTGNFTFNSAPATPGSITGSSSVCSGTSNTYSVAAVGGATSYTWTLPNGWTGTSTSDSIIATAGSSGGTISVTANSTCGSSAPQTLSVSVSPGTNTPTLYNVSGGGSYCAGTGGVHILLNGSQVGVNYQLQLNGTDIGSPVAGPGSAFSFPDQTDTGTYTVVASGSCYIAATMLDSAVISESASVPATPGPISGPTVACSGDADTFSIANVSGATSYTWTLPGGWTGSSTTSSIATVAAAGGGTVTVIANNGCGSSAPQSFTVSTGPTPAMPGAITGPASACSGDADTFSIAAVSGATSYTWTLPGGWTGSSTTTSIAAVAAAGGGTVMVTANNACGSSAPQTFTVSTGPTPATPGIISGPASACSGDADTFSIAAVSGATSYTWTLPGGWTGSSSTDSISTIAAIGGGTISVTANNACGSSAPQTFTVAQGATPAMPGTISGPASACSGDADTFSIAPVSGATSYTWTLSSGWTGSSTSSSIATVAGSGGGIISVTANNACGSSASQSILVTQGATPATPGTISGPASACSGDADTFSIAAVSGATSYTWTLPGGWTGASTTTSIATTAASGGGTISVTANNGCGSSAPQTFTVAPGSVPATPAGIIGSSIVCTGNAVTYSVTPVNGATSYTWTLPAGWSGTSSTDSISTIPSAGGTIYVTANNSCGNSTAQTLAVTLGSIPATPGAITGPDSVCDGSSGTYSVAAVTSATSYVWTLPTGWAGTSGNDSIHATAGTGNGNISVAATNGCGQSPAQTKSVTLNPLPSVSYNFGQKPVCNNVNPVVTLSGGSPAGGVYSGQGVTGNSFNAAGLAAGNYVITYSYTSLLGCTGSDTSTAIVTVCSNIESTPGAQITVYPNPFNDAIIIGINGNFGQGTAVLLDATGREISRTEFGATATSVQINTRSLASGAYLLQIISGDELVVVKKLFRIQ